MLYLRVTSTIRSAVCSRHFSLPDCACCRNLCLYTTEAQEPSSLSVLRNDGSSVALDKRSDERSEREETSRPLPFWHFSYAGIIGCLCQRASPHASMYDNRPVMAPLRALLPAVSLTEPAALPVRRTGRRDGRRGRRGCTAGTDIVREHTRPIDVTSA